MHPESMRCPHVFWLEECSYGLKASTSASPVLCALVVAGLGASQTPQTVRTSTWKGPHSKIFTTESTASAQKSAGACDEPRIKGAKDLREVRLEDGPENTPRLDRPTLHSGVAGDSEASELECPPSVHQPFSPNREHAGCHESGHTLSTEKWLRSRHQPSVFETEKCTEQRRPDMVKLRFGVPGARRTPRTSCGAHVLCGRNPMAPPEETEPSGVSVAVPTWSPSPSLEVD